MQKILVANWKENPDTLKQAKILFNETKRFSARMKLRVIVCPPAPFLGSLSPSTHCVIGAQDVSEYQSGSHTGDISASQVKSVGVQYVIVGHSEKRAKGDNNDVIKEKILRVFEQNLRPIICLGERVRDADGMYLQEIEETIQQMCTGLDKKKLIRSIFAYEPVWAIGKGEDVALSGQHIQETTLFMRKILARIIGKKEALALSILYGGSVFPENVESVLHDSGCQGLLVGRQSLSSDSFKKIAEIMVNTI